MLHQVAARQVLILVSHHKAINPLLKTYGLGKHGHVWAPSYCFTMAFEFKA